MTDEILFYCSFLRELTKVDLSHNSIVTVSDRAFGSQRELRSLNLEGNRLGALTNLTLSGLRKLEVLVLRGNQLEEIGGGAFRHVRKLQELDLGRNRIRTIGNDAFYGRGIIELLENNRRLFCLGTNSFAILQCPHDSCSP